MTGIRQRFVRPALTRLASMWRLAGNREPDHTPMQDRIEQLELLYNNRQYRATIVCFDKHARELAGDTDAMAMLDRYRALKIRSLMVEGEADAARAEIDDINATYQDNELVMAFTAKLLQQLEAWVEILMLKSSSRMVLATQCEVAKGLGDAGSWARFHEAFLAEPAHARESSITLRFAGEDDPSTFSGADIKSFEINTDLPNDNMYINLEIVAEDLSLRINIPGPSNDAICETGSATFNRGENIEDLTVNRSAVSQYFAASPFGVQVVLDPVEITINNIHEVKTP